ncbi:MAG: ABC transporter substrate-binding protein [Caldilineaceae bacterium]|nr:ABC transporter substrate-binding protein [Caldilineaceae bacterium]
MKLRTGTVWTVLSLLLVLSLILAACAPAAAPADAGSAAASDAEAAPAAMAPEAPGTADDGMMRPSGEPKHGGILRTAFGVTTAHFDIHQGGSTSVLAHMYNGLVRLNLVDGLRSVIPDLATSWDVSEDGLTYVFHLREGVTFHDGEPFTSADVVATFNRIMDPPEGVVSVFKDELVMVDSVEAVDDLTVQFNLNAPRSYFLDLLAGTGMVIYSAKSLAENNNDLREVIAPGTGAFKYVEYQTAEKWILERNENYWDSELPYVDGLELLHVPAWSDRGTAVLTGQADMSWNVAYETWVEGESRDDVSVNKLANFGAYWLFYNTTKEPLNDARVRRAMNLAVSRQNLIKAFSSQEQINLTRWVPQGDPYATPPEEIATLPGYREDKTADIEEAKALLAEAGYPDGFSMELLAAAGPQAELLAPAIQDMLQRNLNIQTEIRIIERSLLVEEQKAGNFELVLDTRGHGLSDISPRANLWWRTGGSQNFGQYSNADFDALLDQIDSELDTTVRADLIRQAEELLDQDPPSLLIGYTFHLPMWSNKSDVFCSMRQVEWGGFILSGQE